MLWNNRTRGNGQMGRSFETTLGVLGGIIGVIAGVAVALVGGIGEAFFLIAGASDLYTRAALTISAAVLGVVAALLSGSRNKFSGISMMIAAVLGLVGAGVFYVPASALLGIAGAVAFVRKPELEAHISAKCPNCGAPLESSARFCVACDSPVPA